MDNSKRNLESKAKVTVIADTNQVRSERSHTHLLGNRKSLSELVKVAKLVLPAIVIEEIVQQKRELFESDRQALASNNLLSMAGISNEAIDNIDFSQVENAVRKDRSIPFEVADFNHDEMAFRKLEELAIARKPPFNKGSDKGFKDACVVLSVEEYAAAHPDEKVFLATEDERIGEYFKTSGAVARVRTLKDLKSFFVSGSDKTSAMSTEADDSCASIGDEKQETAVQKLINDLRESAAFYTTHELIADLKTHEESLSRDNAIELLKVAVTNNQVYWIMQDPDIKEFFVPLFNRCEQYLDEDTYSLFVRYAEVHDIRAERRANPQFTPEEIAAYRQFADALSITVAAIGSMASIDCELERVLTKLSDLRNASILEETICAKHVAECFIEGYCVCRTGMSFPVQTLNSFLETVLNSSPEKQETYFSGIKNRLKEKPIDYSDIPF